VAGAIALAQRQCLKRGPQRHIVTANRRASATATTTAVGGNSDGAVASRRQRQRVDVALCLGGAVPLRIGVQVTVPDRVAIPHRPSGAVRPWCGAAFQNAPLCVAADYRSHVLGAYISVKECSDGTAVPCNLSHAVHVTFARRCLLSLGIAERGHPEGSRRGNLALGCKRRLLWHLSNAIRRVLPGLQSSR
jgi:hypothetical protein